MDRTDTGQDRARTRIGQLDRQVESGDPFYSEKVASQDDDHDATIF